MKGPLVVFLGPSLPAAEARRLAPRCTVLPPARQGDVWRALALRPAAIALVDGVFESVPSVWHHELLDALDAGVAVFGGGSMGALRAVELARHGVVGVGRIFAWYRDGLVEGDDEVALLHGGAEHGHRPLTVPLVTVRWTAEVAVAERALERREGRALVTVARGIFYQERTWRRVLRAAAPALRPAALEALRALLRDHPPDPKAEDARATIAAAAAFVRGTASPPPTPAIPRRPSSLVRRRKLAGGVTLVGGRGVESGRVLDALRSAGDAEALRDHGLRVALLAALARSLGLAPSAVDVGAARDAFFGERRVAARGRAAHLAASGLDAPDAARLFEDLALERALLAAAARAVPDGPSDEEGLALGARLSGRWMEVARRLAGRQDGRVMAKRRPADGGSPEPFHNPFGGLAERLGMAAAPPAPPAPPGPGGAGEPAAAAPARAVVRLERKGRGGKEVTVVEKLALDAAELARWLQELKRALGCGGSIEGDALALHGDQRPRLAALLRDRGVRKVTLG